MASQNAEASIPDTIGTTAMVARLSPYVGIIDGKAGLEPPLVILRSVTFLRPLPLPPSTGSCPACVSERATCDAITLEK